MSLNVTAFAEGAVLPISADIRVLVSFFSAASLWFVLAMLNTHVLLRAVCRPFLGNADDCSHVAVRVANSSLIVNRFFDGKCSRSTHGCFWFEDASSRGTRVAVAVVTPCTKHYRQPVFGVFFNFTVNAQIHVHSAGDGCE